MPLTEKQILAAAARIFKLMPELLAIEDAGTIYEADREERTRLYQEFKTHYDFTTSARLANEQVIQRILREVGSAVSKISERKSPLDGRAGLETTSVKDSIFSGEFGRLAAGRGLLGCVLISFDRNRINVDSCGVGDEIASQMEMLGDRLLAAIDDGLFDPEAHGAES